MPYNFQLYKTFPTEEHVILLNHILDLIICQIFFTHVHTYIHSNPNERQCQRTTAQLHSSHMLAK